MNSRNLQLWTLVTALLLIFVVGCDRTQNAPARADGQISSEIQSKINTDANVPSKAIAVKRNNDWRMMNYLAAYSDGSDCKPSIHSTVALSSFDSNMEMVAFGLTVGSTRALMICVR